MTADFIPSRNRVNLVARNSSQINVVAVVDVARALATGQLDGALILIDNSVDRDGQPSSGRGTPALISQCHQGVVINWIVYPVAAYGVPVPVSIRSIRFDEPVCYKLESYGAVDIAHSPDYRPGVTPVYDYWAGLVRPDLPEGRYRYRIDFQLGALTLGISTPAIELWDIPPLKHSDGYAVG